MNCIYYPLHLKCEDVNVASVYNNRAFLYGDGFFESMRWHKGKINFFDDHFLRILHSFEVLKLDASMLDKHTLLLQVEELMVKVKGDARVRLTFFRIASGFYSPESNGTALLIQVQQWQDNNYTLNEKPLITGIYKEQFKSRSSLSGIKSLNALVYVLAGIFARANHLDDVILLNDQGNIAEASSSNIFVIKEGLISTPALDEGCVAGVMRMQAIKFAGELKLSVKEKSISVAELLDADEVFLTNSIRGFITIGSCQHKVYQTRAVKMLHSMLSHL